MKKLNHTILKVEQPTRIADNGNLFFLRGLSGGFGAGYGVNITREEYEKELIKQAGSGRLIETDGVFAFELSKKKV